MTETEPRGRADVTEPTCAAGLYAEGLSDGSRRPRDAAAGSCW
ncbi:hypothetical protein [Streptomyces sp. NPDC002845]